MNDHNLFVNHLLYIVDGYHDVMIVFKQQNIIISFNFYLLVWWWMTLPISVGWRTFSIWPSITSPTSLLYSILDRWSLNSFGGWNWSLIPASFFALSYSIFKFWTISTIIWWPWITLVLIFFFLSWVITFYTISRRNIIKIILITRCWRFSIISLPYLITRWLTIFLFISTKF